MKRTARPGELKVREIVTVIRIDPNKKYDIKKAAEKNGSRKRKRKRAKTARIPAAIFQAFINCVGIIRLGETLPKWREPSLFVENHCKSTYARKLTKLSKPETAKRALRRMLHVFKEGRKNVTKKQFQPIKRRFRAFVKRYYLRDTKNATKRREKGFRNEKKKLMIWASFHLVACHFVNLWLASTSKTGAVLDELLHKAAKSLVWDHWPICNHAYGKYKLYNASVLKVVTLGYNGSRKDKRLRMDDDFAEKARQAFWDTAEGKPLPDRFVDTAVDTADLYFDPVTGPYDFLRVLGHRFFQCYRRVLRGACDASYLPPSKDPGTVNVALHLDLMCAFSTDPNWGRLQKRLVVPTLVGKFKPLALTRLAYLSPDVVFSGLSDAMLCHLPNVSPWKTLVTIKKKKVLLTYRWSTLEWPAKDGVGTHRCLVINAPACETPWGLLSYDEVNKIASRVCRPMIKRFVANEKARKRWQKRRIRDVKRRVCE